MELTDEEREHVRRHFYGVDPEQYWYDVDRKLEGDHGEITVKVYRFAEGRGGGFAWVIPPDGEMRCFADRGLRYRHSRQRAQLFAELWSRLGPVHSVGDSSFVPVPTVVIGEPAVAAYLRAIYDMTDSEIAARLDIKETTVSQYLAHFQEKRR